MSNRADIRREAEAVLERFRAAGAELVDPDILQPAATLLDLYGEDIRARAYVTQDPVRGELMLRPDFTVPVVQAHMANGAEPARYTYIGEVFRRQEAGSGRASEYIQVGFELFDGRDPVAADAEVFALFAGILAPMGLRPAIGDIGVLRAAVDALTTSERRKDALRRHLWRPRRFRALLERFGGRTPPPPTRVRLVEAARSRPAAELVAEAGPLVGLRTAEEIAERVEALVADADEPPVAGPEIEAIEALMTIRAKAPAGLGRLRDVAVDLPGIAPAVDRFERRLEALAARGIDAEALEFEASYGRTTLEYYDGFVFGFYAGDRPDLPPVASGGRYDALTRVLGAGRAIPAVGGIVRPELLHLLGGLPR